MSDLYFGADLFSEFDRLHRQMTNLFGGIPSSIRASRLGAFPPLNIGTTEDSIEIVVFAPGMRAADFDVHVRHDASLDDFTKLKPVFVKENGTVTAGNASGINDAAAAVVLMERSVAEKRGAKPLARLVSYAHAGVDPAYMGIGPVPATKKALERAGITVADLDVIEANEAFAAQACAVSNELGLDPAKVNPNGSGISLGHPIGATGALITVKALYELQRIGGRYALVTMCIGGGQGIAAVFERL